MFENILINLLLLLVALFFVWLAVRLWRSGNLAVRLGGGSLMSLLALVLLAISGAMVRGASIAYASRPVPPAEVSIEYTPERIARGAHLAASLCSSCHSLTGDLPLTGGINLSDDAGMPLGDLYPPNITAVSMTDGEIWTFFRHGRKPNGQLTIMPVSNMGNLSDEDLYAVIAFLRSQEPLAGQVPPLHYSPLALILAGANVFQLEMEPKPASITAPPVGSTAEYGNYIVSYNDCKSCHGERLDGKVVPPAPPGPSLALVRGWTAEQFISTMRTGVDPSGHEMQPPMPWKQIGRLDDVELAAVYEYIKASAQLAGE